MTSSTASAGARGRRRGDAVIVVGSGAGGASLAWSLAHRGLQVLLIEQGDYLRPAPRGGRPGVFITEAHGDRAKPMHYVGGQTKFYGAALYRFRESDFQAVEHEGGVSPSWPFPYETLEPYYERAEILYRVHGSTDSDPSEPPRRSAYPFPPIEHAPIIQTMIERLMKTGTSTAPIPRGIDRGPGGRCVLCADCDAHVCTVDAKMDAEVAALRPALATGNVELLTRTRVLQILTDERGRRAIGVRVLRNGVEETLYADTVAVCAGLPGSAELLRRSANAQHPAGLGGNGGALGKYLAGHSTGMLFPVVGLGPVPAIHTKSFAIQQWYGAAPGGSGPTGVIQMAGQMPFWDEVSRPMRYPVKALGQRSLTAFYMTEALPTPESGLVFEGDRAVGRTPPTHNIKTFRHLRRVGLRAFTRAGYFTVARKRAPYLWHEVGTARMGDDPATSVVDRDLQVHGVDGLYVIDASVLPSAGAVNTGLTIVALALRLGDNLARVRVAGESGAMVA